MFISSPNMIASLLLTVELNKPLLGHSIDSILLANVMHNFRQPRIYEENIIFCKAYTNTFPFFVMCSFDGCENILFIYAFVVDAILLARVYNRQYYKSADL